MQASLLRLLHLCDTSLPIGGFSHSAGLETYVQKKIVKDADTVKQFVWQMLSVNIFYTDAALLSLAYDAALKKDLEKIIELDDTCNAAKLPLEMRQASTKLGRRLLKIFLEQQDEELLLKYNDLLAKQLAHGHYCIVFALLASIFNIEKLPALAGFYYNSAAGIITNAVKLVPLSQQVGQQILISVTRDIEELASKSLKVNEDLVAVCCAGFDIRSMQHEQLYSRLYMS